MQCCSVLCFGVEAGICLRIDIMKVTGSESNDHLHGRGLVGQKVVLPEGGGGFNYPLSGLDFFTQCNQRKTRQ